MTEQSDPDMLDEYDFSGGVRGKYAASYREGTNLVKLDDDVAEIFRSAREVNDALRALGRMIQAHRREHG